MSTSKPDLWNGLVPSGSGVTQSRWWECVHKKNMGKERLWFTRWAEAKWAAGDCKTTHSCRLFSFCCFFFFNYYFYINTVIPKMGKFHCYVLFSWGTVMSCVSKGCTCNRSARRYCFTTNLLFGCSALYWTPRSWELGKMLCASILLS